MTYDPHLGPVGQTSHADNTREEKMTDNPKWLDPDCASGGCQSLRWANELRKLEERLRCVGANRYWEGRWRDESAAHERLRAAARRALSSNPHNFTQLTFAMEDLQRALDGGKSVENGRRAEKGESDQ